MYLHQAGPGHRGPEHGKELSSAVGLPPATAYAQCVPGGSTFDALKGMRAVVYARLSEDHERAESVPTQISNSTKHAKHMGWEVARVFKDQGRSGYSGEFRPGFEAMLKFLSTEAMLKFLSTGDVQVLIARHHDRLTRNAEDFDRLMKICGKAKIKINLYTGGELDLSTASGGFYGFMETGRSWYESAIRSQRVKDAVGRNARSGKRTGGGFRPFGYKIIRQDLGESAPRRWRIVGEELEPTEAEAIKEAAARVLRGESLRGIAMDWNKRGINPVGGNSTKAEDKQRKGGSVARINDSAGADVPSDCGP